MQQLMHGSDAFDFLDLCSFSLAFTQIIQLCATNLTAADQIHMVNAGRMDRESSFNSDTVRNAANSESFTDSAVALGDNGAFESLQTLTVSFNDLYPDTDRVTDIELRYIAADLLCLDGTNNLIHDICLLPS